MKPKARQNVETESLDMVPHEDRTNYYNTEGTKFSPSLEEIAQVAYNRFIEQGSVHGHDVQHWVDAVVLLRATHSKMLANRTNRVWGQDSAR